MKKDKKSFKKTSNKRWKPVSSEEGKFAHIEPVQAQNLEVKVNNDFDRALRTFRSLCQKEKILSIYKERQRFEKPSDKKRRKRNEMKRKMMELDSRSDRNQDFKPRKKTEESE